MRTCLLLFLFPLIFLNGCTSVTLTPVEWQAHQAALESFENWHIRGRMSFRDGNESTTVNINWIQENDNFLINLNGPIGLGAVEIENRDGQIRFEEAGKEAFYFSSLDELGTIYPGLEFPLEELHYWVRGIPVPGQAELKFNENNLLAQLDQGGWTLTYDRYQQLDSGLVLPGRIRADLEPYRLTFIISQWQ